MMIGRVLVCIALVCPALTVAFLTTVSLDSNLVFDPTFYVNTHGDLHKIRTVAEARAHWLTSGIKEGRQGCGSFHSVQYLQRYADLSKAFGTNYRQAIEHYLRIGHSSEGRLGYVEGGAAGRWTISNHAHTLFLSSGSRTAGAIDSLVWDNKEFLNSWDHGRQMQMAMNTNPYGGCFNPTEAGGRDDGYLDTTASKLLHVKAKETEMQTVNHPSFWMRPGDKETGPWEGPCGHNKPALNKQDVYSYEFSKNVSIGCVGVDTCIKFESGFTVAGHWPEGYKGINFEAPAGYMSSDFNVLLNYDLTKKQLRTFTDNQKPVVLATSDGRHAMGVYAPSGQNTDQFQYYNAQSFGGHFASGTYKWDVVFRKNPIPDDTTHHVRYTAYACVGSKSMVTTCLDRLHQSFPAV